MPLDCHEQIVLAVETALKTITAISDLTVDRDRGVDEMPSEEELPLLVIYDSDMQPQDDLTGERGYSRVIDIIGYAGGSDRAAAAAAASELRAEVDRVLFGDVTLGGKARNLELAAEPSPDVLGLAAASPYKNFVRSFTADYATLEDDPYTFA